VLLPKHQQCHGMAVTNKGQKPISLLSETANTRRFEIPAGTTQINIAESYNRGWAATLDGQDLALTKTSNNGMEVVFDEPLRADGQHTIRYHPSLRTIYLPILIGSLVVLGFISAISAFKPSISMLR